MLSGCMQGKRAAGALTPEPIKAKTVKSPDGKDIIFFPAIIIGSYMQLAG